MRAEKYYSTGQDLTISITEIKASSMEEAEAVIQRFIDEIGKVMTDEVRWDEADWTIEENTMNAEGTGYEVTDEGVPNYYEMSDVEADADTLASAGHGTDEDYGYYGDQIVSSRPRRWKTIFVCGVFPYLCMKGKKKSIEKSR